MELIAQKKASLKSGNRQKTVKPPEGRSKWRILPGWRTDGDPTFYHDFGQHFIKDGTDTLKAVYVCVDKTFGKPCEVCGALEHAIKNTSDDTMVELLKKSKASGRVLLNALHVDGDKPTEPQILELSPNTFAEFLNIVQEWGVEVLDLDGGKDVIIERTGKGLQTKYSLQVAAKSVVVSADTMKKVVNLDEYVAQESEEQAKRALANLNAVAGMLPSPTAAKPSLGLTCRLMVWTSMMRPLLQSKVSQPRCMKRPPRSLLHRPRPPLLHPQALVIRNWTIFSLSWANPFTEASIKMGSSAPVFL